MGTVLHGSPYMMLLATGRSFCVMATYAASGIATIEDTKAHMRFKDGLICEHSDAFPIYRWSRQAFGLTGLLLGWSGYFHKKLQLKAKMNLQKFMNQ